ncbi:hypothetical protein QBC34DRAFT_433376 [Podospora aff. communis PSN243]|uniref:BZIP domain-containing protein n=1 Tax=Podospora aff. communis PSN243 TaxID=3040156 RepID=A0AAV9H417_9PEZI|nr:hypothetical protein QBC34DRAFT_433376 [Podospora aff. communis PSN243]
MDTVEAAFARHQESTNTEPLFVTSVAGVILSNMPDFDHLNMPDFDFDSGAAVDHAVEVFGYAPSLEDLCTEQDWDKQPQSGRTSIFDHPPNMATKAGICPETPPFGPAYTFGAAPVVMLGVGNYDSWPTNCFAHPSLLNPFESQHGDVAEYGSGLAGSELTTNSSLSTPADDDHLTATELNPSASTESCRTTAEPRPSHQKRKRGRPRLFQVDGAEDSDQAEPSAPAGKRSTIASLRPSRRTSQTPVGPSPSQDGQNDDEAIRERRRMATTRYRRKLDAASSAVVKKACEAETEYKTLLACRDDLLDQLYSLKNKLLFVSQTRSDSPAMQAYMQAEVQRVRREWGARL